MARQPKLETYLWEGTNRRGEHVKGEQNATNPIFVKADLRRQGVLLTKIRKKPKPLWRKRIRTVEITAFTRQMATMLTAGIPLVQALDLIARGHSNPSMQTMINTIKTEIEGGSSVGEALTKYPKHFNELYRNLVIAGERSGSLDIMFERIATYKEKTDALVGKIKKALFYPASIIFVAIAVTAVLLIFVVPQFQALFSGFGAELPAPTRAVISLSKFFQLYWWALAILFIAMIWGFVFAMRYSTGFAYFVDRVLLQLPIIGAILKKATIARFSRTLSTTFAAGLPLVDALNAVAGASGNLIYTKATLRIRDDIATGQTLQLATRQTNLFPNLVVQMIAIGEESGTLESMLSKVAEIFEREVDNAVDTLSSLLEPFIMIILGVLIGGLVVAMYLPIFKLGSVV